MPIRTGSWSGNPHLMTLIQMATVADLGIERHELRKFYENIAKMENLLKCPKCQKIVRTILTLQCNNLHRICSDCFSGSNCAFCNDGVSEGDIRKTNLDRFISALRQLKYLTNYNEAKTEEWTEPATKIRQVIRKVFRPKWRPQNTQIRWCTSMMS